MLYLVSVLVVTKTLQKTIEVVDVAAEEEAVVVEVEQINKLRYSRMT